MWIFIFYKVLIWNICKWGYFLYHFRTTATHFTIASISFVEQLYVCSFYRPLFSFSSQNTIFYLATWMLFEGSPVALWRICNLHFSSFQITSAAHFSTSIIWSTVWDEGQEEYWDLLENENWFSLVVVLLSMGKQLTSPGTSKLCDVCLELCCSSTVLLLLW